MRILLCAAATVLLRDDSHGQIRRTVLAEEHKASASLVVGSRADVRKVDEDPPDEPVEAPEPPRSAIQTATTAKLSDGSNLKMIVTGCVLATLVCGLGAWYYFHAARGRARRRCDGRLLQPPPRQTLTEAVREVAGWSEETPERQRTISLQQQVDLSGMDLVALVGHLDDTTKLGALHTALHPWATPPATVGALAGMHIASLAADDPYACGAKVLACGGLDKLLGFLSAEEDRRHVAFITLALLAYNDACALEMVAKKVPDQLAPYMAGTEPYPRASVAIMLRYLFFYSQDAKREYMQEHGLGGFTDLLYEEAAELQLAAVTNLLDLVFEVGGFDGSVFMQLRKLGGGLSARLDVLAKSDDTDVAENASYLRQVLSDDSLVPSSSFAEQSDTFARAAPAPA